MESTAHRALVETFEVERVRSIFNRLPSLIVGVLVGVLLVFVFLFRQVDANVLRAWTAFMLSTLTLRGWLWYMFRNASPTRDTARRWEYAAAGAGFLTGLGWAALSGPLYPPPPLGPAHMIILLTTVSAAFAAAAFNSYSRLTFWFALVPTLFPLVVRQSYEAQSILDGTTLALMALIGVALTIHNAQYRMLIENLSRRIETEALLGEQQAIFQAATLGIAILCDGHIVKGNPHLGHLLGRRIQELAGHTLNEYFVSAQELEKLLQDSATAFHHARPHQAIVRLRRADGTEFWAEFSGSALPAGQAHSNSVWLIADVTVRTEHRHTQH